MDAFFDAVYRNLLKDNLWKYLFNGLGITLTVTGFALLIGFSLGFLLALAKTAYRDLAPDWKSPSGILLNLANLLASAFVTLIRGTPTMIQLLIMFNVFLSALDNLIFVCVLTFGLNSAAYVSEIFRAGIQAVPEGQKEAARSLGLSYGQMTRQVVMPQAFKLSLPGLGNEVITLFKETSISGTIGLVDVTRGAGIIITKTFQASIPYLAAALIYLALVLCLESLFRRLEKRNRYAYDQESA